MDGSHFSDLIQSILELDGLLDRLKESADFCGAPSPEHEYWYALLKHKLIPQLSDKNFLIVAVAGGTNTGKSLLFNHLAGQCFSAVDQHASGTKHPVCLLPKDDSSSVPRETLLARYFDSFKPIFWSGPEQPLRPSEEHHLFWIEGESVPKRLWLLDTPDIDSDQEVNWERARAIRNAADVLVAVLTEQKYNDAAVRRFFREAGEAGKPIVLLFNMIDPEEDIKHLPRWLERFCEETRSHPIAVVASPFDRDRAANLDLPFYLFRNDGTLSDPIDFRDVLTDFHFDTIKTQTLLGAVKVLDDPDTGLRAYLHTVERASNRFEEALGRLENAGEAAIEWPTLPGSVLAEEIRNWWHEKRPAWARNINGVYRKVGRTLLRPVQKTANRVSGRFFGAKKMSDDPLTGFRELESRSIVTFVEQLVRQLEKLAETDNPVLKREILELIGGKQRKELIERAHRVLDSLDPVDDEFRQTIRARLDEWSESKPGMIGLGRSLDGIVTVVRPVLTVTLVLSGLAIGGQIVGSVLGEAVIAGGVTAGGEAALQAGSEGTTKGISRLFRTLQEDFVLSRSGRFYAEFQKELWQDVIERLRTGAEVARSDVFLKCKHWRADKYS